MPNAEAVPLEIHVDEGHGPLAVLLHGFPELPSCWRHQVQPLVSAGWRVVAPALRGYAGSPAPTDPSAYTADHLAADVAGVIEGCGESSAVVIGHDWGAAVTWAVAQLRPDRVRAMAALSVPFTPRSQHPPIERMAELFAGSFFYIVHFQQPEIPEAELSADVRDFLLRLYAATSGRPTVGAAGPDAGPGFLGQLPVVSELPEFLSAEVLEESVSAFSQHGFTGPLNYYRAMDLSWHTVPELGATPITCPAAFIAGAEDLVLAFTPRAGMAPPLVNDLRVDLTIPGAGHWIQQERPEETTAALLGFLAGLG